MKRNFIEQQLKEMKQLLKTQKSVLTLEEAAEFSGLSKSYLYKLTSSGRIPHSKPRGKLIYFERETLEKWLLQNKVASNEQIVNQANTIVALNKRGGYNGR